MIKRVLKEVSNENKGINRPKGNGGARKGRKEKKRNHEGVKNGQRI